MKTQSELKDTVSCHCTAGSESDSEIAESNNMFKVVRGKHIGIQGVEKGTK